MVGLSENGDQNAPCFGGKGKAVLLRGERHVSDDPFGMVVDRASLFSIEKDPRRRVDAVPCLGELDAQGIDGIGHGVLQERIEGLNTCAVVLAPSKPIHRIEKSSRRAEQRISPDLNGQGRANRAVNAFAGQQASALEK